MQPDIKFSEDVVPLDSMKIDPDRGKRTFMNAVEQGFTDIEEGRTVCLAMAKRRLGFV